MPLRGIQGSPSTNQPERRKAPGYHDGYPEGVVLPVCGQCAGISGYGRVSAVPEQLPTGGQDDAGGDGRELILPAGMNIAIASRT